MLETGYNRVLTTEAGPKLDFPSRCFGQTCSSTKWTKLYPRHCMALTKSDKPSTEAESLSIGHQTLFVESVN